MGLFDLFTGAVTDSSDRLARAEAERIGWQVDSTYLVDILDETQHKQLKDRIYSSTIEQIEKKYQPVIIRKINEELSKSEIYNAIKNILTNEKNIRNYLSGAWNSDSDGFYIKIEYEESGGIYDDLFTVKIETEEPFGLIIKINYNFNREDFYNPKSIADVLRSEYEKVDLSTILKQDYNNSKLYHMGTVPSILYATDDLLKSKRKVKKFENNGFKIESIDDLKEELLDRADTYPIFKGIWYATKG